MYFPQKTYYYFILNITLNWGFTKKRDCLEIRTDLDIYVPSSRKLSETKLKKKVFTDPDNMWQLLANSFCLETMGDKEKEAWESFKDVVHK